MKISLVALLLFCAPLAQGQLSQSPVDINNRLQDALDRVAEESRKEQELTGGTMAIEGGALAGAALLGTVIGNDFSTQTAPVLYITASGLLTIGGIMNLTRENPFTPKVQALRLRPSVKLDDLQDQIIEGQSLLRQEAQRAAFERTTGGWLTIIAGATNIAIAELSSTPSRLGFEIAGYSSVSLGLADYMIERRRWSGSALVGMGLANAITDRTDPYSPSSDYLIMSGGITLAAGVARIFIKNPAEREQNIFFDSFKNEVQTDFFMVPTRDGILATTQLSF